MSSNNARDVGSYGGLGLAAGCLIFVGFPYGYEGCTCDGNTAEYHYEAIGAALCDLLSESSGFGGIKCGGMSSSE